VTKSQQTWGWAVGAGAVVTAVAWLVLRGRKSPAPAPVASTSAAQQLASIRGLPLSTKPPAWWPVMVPWPADMTKVYESKSFKEALFNAKPGTPLRSDLEAGFKQRRQVLHTLAPDAAFYADKYSKESYLVGGFSVDEYGRTFQGVSWDPMSVVFQTTQTVLPFIPGVGPVAAAGIAAAIALAQGKSVDEAALAAARAALPVGVQIAFDMGVGVALQGKPVDQAAQDATLGYLEGKYPGSKAAYDKGKQMTKSLGVSGLEWLEA
jgi:hypothetical protein